MHQSKDLVTWQEMPLAIPIDDLGYIFSEKNPCRIILIHNRRTGIWPGIVKIESPAASDGNRILELCVIPMPVYLPSLRQYLKEHMRSLLL